MSRPKNRACPACRANDHDQNGDHLYLAAANDNWICSKVQYHEGGQYYIVPNNQQTNEPMFEPLPEDTTEKVPESSPTNMFDEGDSWDRVLAGSSVSETSAPSSGVFDLPAVEYRGIPEAIRRKYGVHHELSVEDRSVVKVFYPIYSEGKQSKWKERVVADKKFFVKEL